MNYELCAVLEGQEGFTVERCIWKAAHNSVGSSQGIHKTYGKYSTIHKNQLECNTQDISIPHSNKIC